MRNIDRAGGVADSSAVDARYERYIIGSDVAIENLDIDFGDDGD
eukprot:SAG11_NODE_36569_length_261_cov_0.512346_1_plen_43_part_10